MTDRPKLLVWVLCGALVLGAAATMRVPAAGAAPQASARFGPLSALVGCWEGYAERPDGSPLGGAERTYAYALGGTFLEAESVIMFPPEVTEGSTDVERSLELISYDTDSGRFVSRSFHDQGTAMLDSVTVVESPRRFVFDTIAIENGTPGMQTRRTLTFEGDDQLIEVFEISMPGAGFRVLRTLHLQRAEE